MLNHQTIGPASNGEYQVTYQTPGCRVPTVACTGLRSHGAAEAEARRLNDAQLVRERALKAESDARGLRGVYPDLKTK